MPNRASLERDYIKFPVQINPFLGCAYIFHVVGLVGAANTVLASLPGVVVQLVGVNFTTRPDVAHAAFTTHRSCDCRNCTRLC